MKGKALIPVVIGLCIGGFALKMVLDTVKKAQGATPKETAVLTLVEEIQRGTEVSEEMIKSVKLPAQLVPAGAFSKKEDLVGRVTRIPITGGLPVMESMLLPKGAKAGLFVKSGFRAVSVKIDESAGVANLLQPGCFVDVIGCFKVKQNNKQDTVSRTLIENVEVAAVGDRISAAGEKLGKDGKKAAPDAKPARTVTIFVKPDAVPQLHLAEQRGKIKLSLRNQGETLSDGTSHDDTINEARVTGEKEQKQEGAGMFDKLAAMFQTKAEDATNAKAAQPKPAKETKPEEPAIKLAHVMTIWNGEDREVMGWAEGDPLTAIQLAGSKSNRGKSRAKSDFPLTPKTSDTVHKPSGQGVKPSPAPAGQQPDNDADNEPTPDDNQDSDTNPDEGSQETDE